MAVLSLNATNGSLIGLNYVNASSYSNVYAPQDTLYYNDGNNSWVYITAIQSSDNL
jgi:hypothetical protein